MTVKNKNWINVLSKIEEIVKNINNLKKYH